MAGRPSKRTPEREARLLEALRAGNTRNAAATYAGIDRGTLENWMHRYSTFSTAVKKAESDAEVRAVAQIAQAARDGNWQASAWWLERRRPEDFGRRDRVEIQVKKQSEQLASEFGVDAQEILAEAERIVAGG